MDIKEILRKSADLSISFPISPLLREAADKIQDLEEALLQIKQESNEDHVRTTANMALLEKHDSHAKMSEDSGQIKV